MEYTVMASTIKIVEGIPQINPLDQVYYTPEHTLSCKDIEELPELYLDKYGEELDRLFGYSYSYLYVRTTNGWIRITE